MAKVLLSALVKRFSVSRLQDFCLLTSMFFFKFLGKSRLVNLSNGAFSKIIRFMIEYVLCCFRSRLIETSTDGELCHSGLTAANRLNWGYRQTLRALQVYKQFQKLTRSYSRKVVIRTLFFIDKAYHKKHYTRETLNLLKCVDSSIAKKNYIIITKQKTKK